MAGRQLLGWSVQAFGNGSALLRQQLWRPIGNATCLSTCSTRVQAQRLTTPDKKVGTKESKPKTSDQGPRWTKWTERILPAFENYRRLHGHCIVPSTFVVPSGSSAWPQATWALPLGEITKQIHRKGAWAQQIKRDETQWRRLQVDLRKRFSWHQQILPAFETFRQVFGHCNVPQKFVVPSEAPWPPPTWRLQLGMIGANIRCREGLYAKQIQLSKERWDRLDFVWDPYDYRWRNQILPALETFRQVFGHVTVPQRFVVPSEPPWPKKAWKLHLGKVVYRICVRGYYKEYVERDLEKWKQLGFAVYQSDQWDEQR